MRVQVLQHVPFEGLGSIQHWLDKQGATVNWTRFHDDPQLPEPDQADLIIVLGGPMSVNDEVALPWLVDEKRFIALAIAAGKPVLGICLGAQLIASAMGARVYPGKHKEIGWFDIQAIPASSDAFRFPERTSVLHWHGETFDLPSGARHLARSVACENQAFQLGSNVIGLQFHLEMMPENVEEIICNCRKELVVGPYIQDEAAICSKTSGEYERTNQLMGRLLDYLVKDVRRRCEKAASV